MFVHIFSSKESVNVGLGQILGVRFKLKLVIVLKGGRCFVRVIVLSIMVYWYDTWCQTRRTRFDSW